MYLFLQIYPIGLFLSNPWPLFDGALPTNAKLGGGGNQKWTERLWERGGLLLPHPPVATPRGIGQRSGRLSHQVATWWLLDSARPLTFWTLSL